MRVRSRRVGWVAVVAVSVMVSVSCTNRAGQWADVSPPTVEEPVTPHPVDVSCVPSGFCMVVVYRSGDDWVEAVVRTWNGSRWADVPGDHYGLGAVSCASATFCALFGGEHISMWDGATLREIPLGTVWPGARVRIGDISCPTVGWCVAVGGGRVATWDEAVGRWVDGGVLEHMTRVACTSRDFCLAAGGVDHFATSDGNGWTAGRMIPGGTVGAVVTDVTCGARHDCVVVGADASSPLVGPTGSGRNPWGLRWRDGTWGHEPVRTRLVSCGTPTRCVGVNDPPGAPAPTMLAVGCPPGVSCGPVAWVSTPPVAIPRGATLTSLTAISCVPAWCLAVGSGQRDGQPIPVAARWTF